MIKILAIASDTTGVGYFRTVRPHQKLQELFPNEFHVDIELNNKPFNVEELKKYDIIHFHKTISDYSQMEMITSELKKAGVITIMDVDDYWAPGTHHPAYQIIKKNEIDKKISKNLTLADFVTTTTGIFADEIKKYNKNVYVLPNAIDKNEGQYTPTPEPKGDRLRFGWLGGSSHLHDLQLLNGTANKLKGSNLDKDMQFVVCGFDTRGVVTIIDPKTGQQTQRPIQPMESVWYKYEQIFTDNYKNVSDEYKKFLHNFQNIDKPSNDEFYRRVWTKPVNSYATNYNLFDVSLAPLVDNKFNIMKSQLKVIEAGFHKKALIAQAVGPYTIDLVDAVEKGGTINEKGNALLVPKGKDKLWFKYIKKLIENPDLVAMLSENLHNTVKDKYELTKVTTDRGELYKKILSDKKS